MALIDSLLISGAGMKAQSERLRVVAENIANADSTGRTPEEDPYRRKVVTFQNVLNRELGMETVKVDRVTQDPSDFVMRYQPWHPAANGEGYVKYPNVNSIIEVVDMKEAQRAYEANLNAVEISKSMLMRTIDLLR